MRHPGVSFPLPFEALDGYIEYRSSAPPEFDPALFKAVEIAPVEVELTPATEETPAVTEWVQQWEIVPLTPEEIAQREAERIAALPKATKLAFRNRFTQTEKVAIEIAALDDPSAAMAQRQAAAALRAYLADLSAATFIDLMRPDTRAGVQALESMGLLAPGRALEILDTPLGGNEIYRG
ncbi:hypothetical protein [Comamonas humi]